MKALLVAALALAGCAHQEAPKQPASTHTTVYRYSSTACEASEPIDNRLKQALKSRDEWKHYAESLEKLTTAKPTNEAHP